LTGRLQFDFIFRIITSASPLVCYIVKCIG